MPFYSFRCTNGHSESHYAKIIDRDAVRQCDACGANLHRCIEAPYVRADIPSYRSPVTGQWVDSRAQRTEDLKRHGCIEWEPGLKQDAPRLKAEADEKAFAPMAATIEKTARELVAAGKMSPL